MATKPDSTDPHPADTNTVDRETAQSETSVNSSIATPPHAGPGRAPSRGTRWVLASIASVGLLSLGLLGGILIGQNTAPAHPYMPAALSGGSGQYGGPAHFRQLPDDVRERIESRVKERMKDFREAQREGQGAPWDSEDVSPSPEQNDG